MGQRQQVYIAQGYGEAARALAHAVVRDGYGDGGLRRASREGDGAGGGRVGMGRFSDFGFAGGPCHLKGAAHGLRERDRQFGGGTLGHRALRPLDREGHLFS